MKKVLAGLTVLTLLAFGGIAFAHGTGGWGGGHMMDYGFGGHMMESGHGGYGMGYGYGGHMKGWTGENDQKFLDETVDLRKELHDKKFEYREAVRDPKTTKETITKLEKEIDDLKEKLFAKTPRTATRTYRGYGCW